MRLQAEGRLDTLVCAVGQRQRQGQGQEEGDHGEWGAVKGPGDLPPQTSRTKAQHRADSLGLVAGEGKVAFTAGPWARHLPASPLRLALLQGWLTWVLTLQGPETAGPQRSQGSQQRGCTSSMRGEKRDKEGSRGDRNLALQKATQQVSTLGLHKKQDEVTGSQPAQTAAHHSQHSHRAPAGRGMDSHPQRNTVEPSPGWALPPMGLHSPRPSATLALTTCMPRLYGLDLSTRMILEITAFTVLRMGAGTQ